MDTILFDIIDKKCGLCNKKDRVYYLDRQAKDKVWVCVSCYFKKKKK